MLKELDPVQIVLVLMIELIGLPPPISILASKLGFTLAYFYPTNYGLSEEHGEVASNSLIGYSCACLTFSFNKGYLAV